LSGICNSIHTGHRWSRSAAGQPRPDSTLPADRSRAALRPQGSVVTAQKRSERLVDVPISISVVSPEQSQAGEPPCLNPHHEPQVSRQYEFPKGTREAQKCEEPPM
jgi:hypothetical protein